MAAYGQYQFGPGRAWVIQLTDNTGTAIAVPVPRRIGAVQEVSLNIDQATKPGHGGADVALVSAPAPMKLTAKFKFLQLAAVPLTQLLTGNPAGTPTGNTLIAVDIAGSIPGSSTYTITPTVPSSGTYGIDLGVRYGIGATNGVPGTPMTYIGSGSLTTNGQYKQSAGTYTFYSGDASQPVVMDFTYTVATGYLVELQQVEIGSAPTFQIVYRGILNGKQAVFVLYNVVSDKLAFASKLDNYNMPELDVSIFEPTGILGTKVIDLNLVDL